jgi:uncharacterized membrane protein
MFFPPIAGYAVLLLVLLVLAMVHHRGGLSRNSVVGIRTQHTLASDEAWAAAHATAQPFVWAMTAIAGVHAVALLAVQLGDLSEALGHVLAVSGFLGVLGVALLAWKAADRAATATTDRA